MHATKQRLLDAGLRLLLAHGYNDLGIQALLEATNVPKGSFYHHFKDKEDFALQVLAQYLQGVHATLDTCLSDQSQPPLQRVRRFFETTEQTYREQGYMGCLMGALGQELSGVNEVFRLAVETCLTEIAARLTPCLEEAQRRGEIPATLQPRQLAELLVNCWEGATLRSRLRREPSSLTEMLDFYFAMLTGLTRQAAPAQHDQHSRRG